MEIDQIHEKIIRDAKYRHQRNRYPQRAKASQYCEIVGGVSGAKLADFGV